MQDKATIYSEKSRWIRDLKRFLSLKSQFVLSGNVRDYHILEHSPGVVVPAPIVTVLNAELKECGYARTIVYSSVDGFKTQNSDQRQNTADEAFMRDLGLTPASVTAPAGLDLLGETLERFVSYQGEPAALIVNFASRLAVRQDNLSDLEHRFFSRAFVYADRAQPRPCGPNNRPFFNTIFWIVDKETDLPDWFIIDNPRLRHIPVAKPDHHARRAVANALLATMPGAESAERPELSSAEQAFVDETEGLLLADLIAISELGRAEDLHVSRIADAVRRYKVGVTDDQWRKLDKDKIRNANTFVRNRVKGQEHAITHMLDIIKRAITGVGAARSGRRPRGVAFLAGPTGVGKTELAKTITHLLFGDENAYIRFDMSEFSAEHADQRLIGAPPGYLGYDAGGELTNAIREKPFSVVLFDEIEKAHPRILDKFLQILDDGVLTSGRGDRVYFSEAFIVFTSNLGIYKIDDTGQPVANVSPEDSLEEVRSKVGAEIDRYFKYVLNRPEILNRLGENIIVFDWIRPGTAVEILDQIITSTLDDVAAQEIIIDVADPAREVLRELCLADLRNGGRGIRNQVEAHLINPLARRLFDADAQPGSRYTINSISPGRITDLSLVPSVG